MRIVFRLSAVVFAYVIFNTSSQGQNLLMEQPVNEMLKEKRKFNEGKIQF